jgi:biopolymer transport protein ExbB/TolQ
VARAFAGTGGPFKAVTCLVAFAGLAALAMRLMGLVVQFGAMERQALPPVPQYGQSVDDVGELLVELDAAPMGFDATYLGQRLRRALELISMRGSAESLEVDLRGLAEADRQGLAQRYAVVRLMAISLPMIGVAGTVAGVGAALAGLTGDNWQAALPGVAGAIGLACGGLMQALALTVLLLAARLGVETVERRLLATVDDAVNRQLLGRFPSAGTDKDPHLASIQRISERLLETVEAAAERHDAAIGQSLAAATRRWEDMASTASSVVERTIGQRLTGGLEEHAKAVNGAVAKLAEDLQSTIVRHAEILGENIDHHTAALADALEHHTAVMTQTEKSLAAENQRHLAEMEASLGEAMLLNTTRQEKLICQSEDLLKEMQVALVEAAGTTVAQQEQLVKQSDVLLKVVEATGQIRRLEEALNSNLNSLAASHNFEQTVTSLAAAVQLLSVRLRQPAIVRNGIDLSSDDAASQAA